MTGNADYSAVSGRKVAIWPDHDNEGATALLASARACKTAGAAHVFAVDYVGDPDSKQGAADLNPIIPTPTPELTSTPTPASQLPATPTPTAMPSPTASPTATPTQKPATNPGLEGYAPLLKEAVAEMDFVRDGLNAEEKNILGWADSRLFSNPAFQASKWGPDNWPSDVKTVSVQAIPLLMLEIDIEKRSDGKHVIAWAWTVWTGSWTTWGFTRGCVSIVMGRTSTKLLRQSLRIIIPS